jgi:F-type H+/Na+-transporting ATPase subunit alpha
VISIYAGTKGFLDDVPLNKVDEFEKGMLNWFQTSGRDVYQELEKKKAIDSGLEKKLEEQIRNFKSNWQAEQKKEAAAA